jgi:hypothetical protein
VQQTCHLEPTERFHRSQAYETQAFDMKMASFFRLLREEPFILREFHGVQYT